MEASTILSILAGGTAILAAIYSFFEGKIGTRDNSHKLLKGINIIDWDSLEAEIEPKELEKLKSSVKKWRKLSPEKIAELIKSDKLEERGQVQVLLRVVEQMEMKLEAQKKEADQRKKEADQRRKKANQKLNEAHLLKKQLLRKDKQMSYSFQRAE